MKAGVMGVAVLIVALSATLMASWAMSMDVEEVSIVRYTELTPIESQFATEQVPLFTEYSPSTNYTQYYTDETKAFTDLVDYTRSARANQYKLNIAPDLQYSGVVDLSSVTGDAPDLPSSGTHTIAFYMSPDKALTKSWGNTYTLTSVISELEPSGDILEYRSADKASDIIISSSGASSAGWVIFSLNSDWIFLGGSGIPVMLSSNELRVSTSTMTTKGGIATTPLCLSCKIDLSSQQAYLYTDNDCKNLRVVASLDDVIISYGGTETATGHFNLATSVNARYSDAQDPEYMDPSKGVELA